MNNLSFLLFDGIMRRCTLVITNKVDQHHQIVFPRAGYINNFYNLIDTDFSNDTSSLYFKKIYNDDLLSLLKARARLRFNGRFPDSTFQEYFFD